MDATTHSISVMEAGGVTLVSEVPKVTHQVSAWWGWLPRAMWSAHIARWRIEEALPFTFIICQLGILRRVLDGDLLLTVQHLDLG